VFDDPSDEEMDRRRPEVDRCADAAFERFRRHASATDQADGGVRLVDRVRVVRRRVVGAFALAPEAFDAARRVVGALARVEDGAFGLAAVAALALAAVAAFGFVAVAAFGFAAALAGDLRAAEAGRVAARVAFA
jgi:hypothetical protein